MNNIWLKRNKDLILYINKEKQMKLILKKRIWNFNRNKNKHKK
jgi:hypothetical protein